MSKLRWKVLKRFMTPVETTGCYWETQMLFGIKDPDDRLSAALSCITSHSTYRRHPLKIKYIKGKLNVEDIYYKLVT